MALASLQPTPLAGPRHTRQVPISNCELVSGSTRKGAGAVIVYPSLTIQKELRLYDDLMLDSLDVTELILTIEKEFHHRILFQMLETVQDVLDAGKGIPRFKKKEEILQGKTIPQWLKPRPEVQPPEGKSIGEAFLRSCDRMGSSLACSDLMTTVSYARLKSLAVGLVDRVKKFPGKEVGLLIPSTGEMYPLIFALILAGKIPVMLNWSQGPFLMDQVLKETAVEVIVTTTAFLQHLPLELSEQAEEKMVLLEEISLGVTFKMRQEALELCRLPTEELLHRFKLGELTGKETAVLLFTSGTEKTPKGVPLSHHNLLSNHRAVLEFVKFTLGRCVIRAAAVISRFWFFHDGDISSADWDESCLSPIATGFSRRLKTDPAMASDDGCNSTDVYERAFAVGRRRGAKIGSAVCDRG